MATHLTLQLHQLLYNNSKSFGLDIRKKTIDNALLPSNPHAMEKRNDGSSDNNLLSGSWSKCYTSSWRCSPMALSAKDSFVCIDQSKDESDVTLTTTSSQGTEFNRVNCIVWLLHESSRSFSQQVESLRVAGSGPELAMAWLGKDVHEWHRHIAYQVAVYVLMKTAIDVEILLSHDRQHKFSPVREILTPLRNQMGEYIESQLKMRHPDLVQWFRVSEMPHMAGYFVPLLKKWSMEYAGSGVAGIIVAIACCTAVVNLGSGRIFCPLLTLSFKDVLVKLMDHSLDLASVDKLHQLATEAGFELDLLSHFGRKILPSEKIEDLEFWIKLAHKKLLKAFHEESILSNKQNLQYKIQPDSLATLGLFAYLGRRTRIFLSTMGIKDLDDMVKDFLSYLECGSLFIYPEFSSIPVYQFFMEVVTDEIGWLDFYASYAQINRQDKRSKHHACQAEKEIILSVVFTVCYDIFSGFAHFTRSTQQPLETTLLSYLLRCQGLLSVCLQDHWAAYAKSGVDCAASGNPPPSIGSRTGHKISFTFEAQRKSHDLTTEECPKSNSQFSSTLKKAPIVANKDKATFGQGTCIEKINFLRDSFIMRYCIKLASTTADIWMGTQLLYIDIKVALGLLIQQAHGCKTTRRQRKTLERTLTDIITLLPVTILMLLPVTAVGHAAMLAAIKKYMPFLIPSPYSSERLDVVKQLKRTREMDDQSWGNLEDPSSICF